MTWDEAVSWSWARLRDPRRPAGRPVVIVGPGGRRPTLDSANLDDVPWRDLPLRVKQETEKWRNAIWTNSPAVLDVLEGESPADFRDWLLVSTDRWRQQFKE